LKDPFKHPLGQSRKALTENILARLNLGLTMCRLAKTAEGGQFARYLAHASKALEAAHEIMWGLDLNHPDFDRLTALCERLRFELDSLKP
jgi:hypothetical protein